jgi:uncharacterized protein (TIGR02996 family)
MAILPILVLVTPATRAVTWRLVYQRTVKPLTPKLKSAGALLAEILANPDDDAPRLVYADWLTQREDPRGEFITIQCELARTRDAAPASLREREAALLKKHKKAWVGEFAGTRIEYGFKGGGDYVKGTPTKWYFARGFVDGVDMQVPDFVRNAPALFSCEPVRWYHPTNGSVSELLECTAIDKLRELVMGPWKFRGAELAELAADTKMTSLELLNLSGCRIGVKAMIEFAEHAVEKPSLRRLWLAGNSFGDKGAIALSRSPILRSLHSLNLTGNKLTDVSNTAFATSPHAKGIRDFEI